MLDGPSIPGVSNGSILFRQDSNPANISVNERHAIGIAPQCIFSSSWTYEVVPDPRPQPNVVSCGALTFAPKTQSLLPSIFFFHAV